MRTYIIIPKVGDTFTLKALAIDAREGALFFNGAGGPVAIFPVAEPHAVIEEETAKALRGETSQEGIKG